MDRPFIRPSVSSVHSSSPSTSIHLVEMFIVLRPNPSMESKICPIAVTQNDNLGRPIPSSYRPTV